MGNELRVSRDDLRRAATMLGQAIDRMDADLSALEGELGGFGQPWGGDEIGMLIGACYEGALDMAMECFGTNMDELDGFVEDLEKMADNYRGAEDLSEIEVNRVREILG
ncbi:hypothetical protein GCM10010191_38840 [Actinomadura vinacea]|uniref:WXG100 family type VII secretion target n=1 Tax=Actinomadura vinacea TaxID=115336 RepID=A0ABN3J696_9ACTN